MKSRLYTAVCLLGLVFLSACGGGGDAGNDQTNDNPEVLIGCDNLADFDPSNPLHVNVCERDADGDGIEDDADNCPVKFNVNQTDTDLDTLGDACDSDADMDGIENDADNCPLVANVDQANMDEDDLGDACDLDNDNDGYDDTIDNCPLTPNQDQLNNDEDELGDACDTDSDNDTFLDEVDNCPFTPQNNQFDVDNDGIGDACDTENAIEVCKPVTIPTNSFPWFRVVIKCSLVPVESPTYCEVDTAEAHPVPARTNANRGKVRESQLIAAIMVIATGLKGHEDLTTYALSAIRAARLANNKTEKWNDCEAEKAWSFTDSTPKLTYQHQVLGVSAGMKIYSSNNSVIVAFAGTSKASDLYRDISSKPERLHDIDFHGGVLNHWLDYKNVHDVFSKINDYGPNPQNKDPELSKIVYFTGHSLGGATANVALFDYVKTYGLSSAKFPQSYTFGATPVVEKGNSCVWDWDILGWVCKNNPDKYDLSTAYGERTYTHLKNLVHNFANVHTEGLKNDPVPHFFSLPKPLPIIGSHLGYSHVGYHYTMHRNGDNIFFLSLNGDEIPLVTSGSVTYSWRFRSADNGFHVRPSIGFLAPVMEAAEPFADIPQHNTCFYSRSLEFTIDDTEEKWLNSTSFIQDETSHCSSY